jgi:hypothetical protein
MDAIILDKITFNPNRDQIVHELRIKPGSKRAAELALFIDHAVAISRPKAIYKIVDVEISTEDQVLLDGYHFNSRLLSSNLADVHRAFPYVITSGTELHEWMNSIEDPFTGYMADSIVSFVLDEAYDYVMSHLVSEYGLKKTGTMNPGSLEDWPLQAQTPLFALLGDPRGSIGVYLTDSLLMIPRQSVSGLLFETDRDYVNCQLCPRGNCSHRQAPYDPKKHSQYLPS